MSHRSVGSYMAANASSVGFVSARRSSLRAATYGAKPLSKKASVQSTFPSKLVRKSNDRLTDSKSTWVPDIDTSLQMVVHLTAVHHLALRKILPDSDLLAVLLLQAALRLTFSDLEHHHNTRAIHSGLQVNILQWSATQRRLLHLVLSTLVRSPRRILQGQYSSAAKLQRPQGQHGSVQLHRNPLPTVMRLHREVVSKVSCQNSLTAIAGTFFRRATAPFILSRATESPGSGKA